MKKEKKKAGGEKTDNRDSGISRLRILKSDKQYIMITNENMVYGNLSV